MGKSGRVSAATDRAIARVVGECRELGEDAVAWQGHALAAFQELVGVTVRAVGGTGPAGVLAPFLDPAAAPGRPAGPARAAMYGWLPLSPDAVDSRGVVHLLPIPGRAVARTSRPSLGDTDGVPDPFAYDFLQSNGLDEGAIGRVPITGESGVYAFTVVRATGGRPLTAREGRVCGRLFEALAPHLGRGLLLTHRPSRHGLPPRARQVLDGLLDGDGEKQIAVELSLHPTTVHDHVKRVYRHFGVSSRAELLAYFLRLHRYRAGR